MDPLPSQFFCTYDETISFSFKAPPIPPIHEFDRYDLLFEAISSGTDGKLALEWEREFSTSVESIPDEKANIILAQVIGEQDFAHFFKIKGCKALFNRLVDQFSKDGNENSFFWPTKKWREWGFLPPYGEIIKEDKMMDLTLIQKKIHGFKGKNRELSSLSPRSQNFEPYSPESFLIDISIMALNAMYFFGPSWCKPPFSSVVEAAAACAKGDTALMENFFLPFELLPPGFCPVRIKYRGKLISPNGELIYQAAYDMALLCTVMFNEIKETREYFIQSTLRKRWLAILLPDELKWYQSELMKMAVLKGEKERARNNPLLLIAVTRENPFQ